MSLKIPPFISKYSSLFLLLLIANIFFLIANIPFIERIRQTPTGQIPTYQHHTVVMDYLGYLEIIRESKDEGSWVFRDLYTTEPTSTTRNMLYFILLGKLAWLFHISPTAIYHLVRIIEFEIFVIVLYLFCKNLLGKVGGFWASFISIFAGPPAAIFATVFYGKNDLGIPAWWMLHPFRAIDMLPHHQASAILLILELYLVIKNIQSNKIHFVWLAGIAAFFSTVFHPISALLFGIGQPISAVLFVVITLIRSNKINFKYFSTFFIPFAFTCLAAGIIRFDVTTSPPFNAWLNFDVMWYDRYVTYVRDYIIGGGPLLFITIPLIVYFLISANQIQILIAIWAILTFILIPVSTPLGVAKFRFALLLPYIPLSILAVLQIQKIVRKSFQPLIKYCLLGVYAILFLPITISSLPVMYQAWQTEVGSLEPGMYHSRDWLDAVMYLTNHAPKYSRIFSGEINGIQIPAYIPAISYVGQYAQTINFEDKKILVREYFGNFLDYEQSNNLLKENGINYIFYSPEEQEWGPGYLEGLPIFYQNNTITIFEVPQINTPQQNRDDLNSL